jgi:hypothetical protein
VLDGSSAQAESVALNGRPGISKIPANEARRQKLVLLAGRWTPRYAYAGIESFV